MKVKISIETKQYDENRNNDTIFINTEGELYEKNDFFHIVYKEENNTNKLSINKKTNEVSIKKFGEITSKMIFRKNSRDFIKYSTPYGIFNMDINTNSLDLDINDNGIFLKIDYDIKIENLFNGKNEINIKII